MERMMILPESQPLTTLAQQTKGGDFPVEQSSGSLETTSGAASPECDK